MSETQKYMSYEFSTQSENSFLIERVNNGYILSWFEELEDGTPRIQKEIIEESDEDEGGKETLSRLFERLAEHFGHGYDKYGKSNLRIVWDKKGHKLE